MSSLNEREKAFENKYANDETLKFKTQSRAVKQLGFWAAEKLGLSGQDAECYAEQVIESDFEKPGVEDVFEKIEIDFKNKDIAVERETLKTLFAEQIILAKHSLMEEG